MKYNYAWQKFFEATNSLVGSLSLRERLVFAAQHLVFLQKTEIPKELSAEFEDLMNNLTKTSAKGDEGSIKATVMMYSDIEAEIIAKKILSMYNEVCKLHYCR